MEFLISVLRFIGILLLVIMMFNIMIVVHEWGHFLAGRWRGLYIDRFQIWFGKPIWKKKYNGVQYGLGSIPAGGFVSLPQMAPMESIEGKVDDGFHEVSERLQEVTAKLDRDYPRSEVGQMRDSAEAIEHARRKARTDLLTACPLSCVLMVMLFTWQVRTQRRRAAARRPEGRPTRGLSKEVVPAVDRGQIRGPRAILLASLPDPHPGRTNLTG